MASLRRIAVSVYFLKSNGSGLCHNSHGAIKEHQHAAYEEEASARAEGYPNLCPKVIPSVIALSQPR